MYWVKLPFGMVVEANGSHQYARRHRDRCKTVVLPVREWAWEQGTRYVLRAWRISVSEQTYYVSHYDIGFTDPNVAFAFKMRFG